MEDLDEYYAYENILQRMLNKVSDNIDKREGSIIYDAVAPCAAEIAQMYLVLKDNIDLVFIDTSVEEYLDKLCNQVGISRRNSTNSIRQGLFYDENNNLVDIEIGERFSIDDLTYIAIEKIEDGKFKLQCETAGVVGNRTTGDLIPIDYIESLGKAELGDVLIPGEDEETDEELRIRCYESIKEKSFAGNSADYKAKTKQIDGVGAVKVTPVWNGGGTVKLTILDSEFNKASNVLVQKVQDEICPDGSNKGLGLAPVGHSVTVVTVAEYAINLSTKVTITEGSNIDQVKQQITKQVNSYLSELRKNWEDSTKLIVRLSQIEARILNISEVLDIENTTINNTTSNIELEEMQIPVLGEVNVS